MCTWHGLYSQHSEAETGGSLPWGYTVKENKSVWGDRGKRQRCRGGGTAGRREGQGEGKDPLAVWFLTELHKGSGAEAGELQLQPRSACHHTPQRHLSAWHSLPCLAQSQSQPVPQRGAASETAICVFQFLNLQWLPNQISVPGPHPQLTLHFHFPCDPNLLMARLKHSFWNRPKTIFTKT